MDIKECFDRRLLRRIGVDKDKSESSLRISREKLGRARELFQADFYEEALISAYTLMFHSARALLYSDGIQEKSHFAIYIYLKEKYWDEIGIGLVEGFKSYQMERHGAIYGFEQDVAKEDAEEVLIDCESFLIKVKSILEVKNGSL